MSLFRKLYLEKVKSRCAVKSIWKGDVVIYFVCVREGQIALPRSIVFGKVIWLFVLSVLEGLIALPRSKYMERYFGCSFFTTFFLREKESGGKKSAYKGDCAAIRYAPIRRSLPLIYPPDDCSADSDSIGLYPKRSASVKPPVSKILVSCLTL